MLETGDDQLLQFAHNHQGAFSTSPVTLQSTQAVYYRAVPIVIVFTQYDRLVRSKELELRQKHPGMRATELRERSVGEAGKAFEYCLQLLKRSMKLLGIPMPSYATASGIFAPFLLYCLVLTES